MIQSIKKPLRAVAGRIKRWYQEDDLSLVPPPFENTYGWIGDMYRRCMKDPLVYHRPQYVWGAIQGVAEAKALEIPRVSLIEFGVAYGLGVNALEHVAEILEAELGIGIEIHGFDSGGGLPKPEDYRDCPNLFSEGYYPPDLEQLEKKLKRTRLHEGLVQSTVPEFLKTRPAPIAFIAFDLDLYSATTAALKVLGAAHEELLPRVFCYFDDIVGYTFSEYNGGRLAISDFNATHEACKISPIHCLQYFVPPLGDKPFWKEAMYLAHFFHHPLYARSDGSVVPTLMDCNGRSRSARR